MSMRRPASPELSHAARARLDALRRDLLGESDPGRSRPSAGGAGDEPPVLPGVVTGAGAEAATGTVERDPDPAIPAPGRHAVRRPRPAPAWLDAVADRLPAGLGDRPLGAAHVAVVAVLAAIVIAGGAWWALQVESEVVAAGPRPAAGVADPAAGAAADDEAGAGDRTGDGTPGPPGEEPGPLVDLPGAQPRSPAAPAGASPRPQVVVDVAGKVRRPGLATLPEGARVADALEAAGGPRRGVRLTSLNLARVLVDGEQVLVGVQPPSGGGPAAPGSVTGPQGATTSGGAAPGSAALVNLNTADGAALETLPGVGPVTAAAILAWREERGGFRAVTELLEVSGIGPATLEDLTPLVTV